MLFRSPRGVASAPNGSLVRRSDTGVIDDANPDYGAEFAVTDANRRLHQLMKQGYIDRAHNAYRMTDEITVLEPQGRRRHRIDMIV